ncbi:MAG TPA: histidine kinase [Actinophytocola sp.]|uniref:sensor histidine kinase n=1 Tax=Actinophytocola sp. TaxID=1872138 RepID=UPI002DFFC6B1|nr:histidine kinase [Actinophytocola sp.]
MHDLLRSVWDEPRPPNPPPRRWLDWALVGALGVAAVLEGVLRPDLPWRAVSVVVVVGILPTLLWRRTRPLLMVAIAFGTCAAASLVVGGDLALNTAAYLLLLQYSLLRWGSGRDAVVGSSIVFGKLLVGIILGYMSPADLIAGFGILSAAGALGAALRYRARARMRELDQVKLLERERLARDLHDTVAHHVSAMAIRAQAGLAMAASQPNAAIEALTLIESEASRALTEMRGMVRVLRRNQPVELAPSPRVSDLELLAGPARPGPAVEVEITGAADDLPPPVGAAIYRLAQESVTNARRHARRATRIEVRVAVDDTSVHLRVSDDGDTALTRPAGSSGFGLIGMIERADLLGGTCEAGPDPDRGWTVTAVLPRTGTPA